MSKQADSLLLSAAENNKLNQAIDALSQGANVDAFRTDSDNGESALMLAFKNGNVEIMQLLIGKGAKVDTEDFNGYTALFYAAEAGIAAMQTLINAGCDIDIKNSEGQDIVSWANEFEYQDVVDYILSIRENKKLTSVIKGTNHDKSIMF